MEISEKNLKKITTRKNKNLKLMESFYWENELEFPTQYVHYTYYTSSLKTAHLLIIIAHLENKIEYEIISKIKDEEEINEQIELIKNNTLKFLKEAEKEIQYGLEKERYAAYIDLNKRFQRYRPKKKQENEENEE